MQAGLAYQDWDLVSSSISEQGVLKMYDMRLNAWMQKTTTIGGSYPRSCARSPGPRSTFLLAVCKATLRPA